MILWAATSSWTQTQTALSVIGRSYVVLTLAGAIVTTTSVLIHNDSQLSFLKCHVSISVNAITKQLLVLRN